MSETIDILRAERDALKASNERLKSAAIAANEEICQTLGAVLGYPWFKDSPEIFPNASEADGVCVGPDTAETLAVAAAGRIKTLKASNERMEAALRAVVNLIDDSYGVAGLHLNGDVAPWDELRTGGLYDEWLVAFDTALSTQPVETDEERDERRARIVHVVKARETATDGDCFDQDLFNELSEWPEGGCQDCLAEVRAIAESDKKARKP